jgi:hypothetical protein
LLSLSNVHRPNRAGSRRADYNTDAPDIQQLAERGLGKHLAEPRARLEVVYLYLHAEQFARLSFKAKAKLKYQPGSYIYSRQSTRY